MRTAEAYTRRSSSPPWRTGRDRPGLTRRVRVCLVYDHLYPATIGGGERWMHDLALALAGAGHDVTYLTMRHWDDGPPVLPGVDVRRARACRRACTPTGGVHSGRPLRFGLAVGRSPRAARVALRRRAHASFPYFPLLAAGRAAPPRLPARRRLVEVWTRSYWRRYAGGLVGTVGWLVQRACVHVRHQRVLQLAMHAERLCSRRASVARTRRAARPLRRARSSPHRRPDGATLSSMPDATCGRSGCRSSCGRSRRPGRDSPSCGSESYGDGPERVESPESSSGARPRATRSRSRAAAAGGGRGRVCARRLRRDRVRARRLRPHRVSKRPRAGRRASSSPGAENASAELVVDGVNGAIAREATAGSLAAAIGEVRAGGSGRCARTTWLVQRPCRPAAARAVARTGRDAYRQLGVRQDDPVTRGSRTTTNVVPGDDGSVEPRRRCRRTARIGDDVAGAQLGRDAPALRAPGNDLRRLACYRHPVLERDLPFGERRDRRAAQQVRGRRSEDNRPPPRVAYPAARHGLSERVRSRGRPAPTTPVRARRAGAAEVVVRSRRGRK